MQIPEEKRKRSSLWRNSLRLSNGCSPVRADAAARLDRHAHAASRGDEIDRCPLRREATTRDLYLSDSPLIHGATEGKCYALIHRPLRTITFKFIHIITYKLRGNPYNISPLIHKNQYLYYSHILLEICVE